MRRQTYVSTSKTGESEDNQPSSTKRRAGYVMGETRTIMDMKNEMTGNIVMMSNLHESASELASVGATPSKKGKSYEFGFEEADFDPSMFKLKKTYESKRTMFRNKSKSQSMNNNSRINRMSKSGIDPAMLKDLMR